MNKNCFGKMHYGLLLIMISFFSLSSLAQSDYRTDKWRFSDPKQFGFTVLDVQFYDNNFGIAVGANGGIARTTDGGAKWIYGPFTFTSPAGLTTNGSFNDVHIATSSTAYAVGTNGMMAKTVNGGQNWTFVNTPLYANARSINTCWFINEDIGYIAGQWNTPDSIPKVYFTRNGGSTWDSLATPAVNGTTKVGFINNATYPSVDYNITGKAKEIYRIQFINNTIGYISGGGASNFPNIGIPNITSTSTCAFTGSQTTGSHNASLLWKFDNGTLTDYSISKERLGYTGYPATLNCTSKFASVTQTVQQFRALNIINDSTIVMMSFNNNVVIKVSTGVNDSTLNVNRPGIYEKGKYEILNTGNAGAPPGYPAIPAVQVLVAGNPYQMRRASNGKLYAAANFGLMWTSVDTGRNWVREYSLPQGRNYSSFATWAFDILPNGKFITMGQGGVVADSIPGGASYNSNYIYVGSSGNKVDFPDCNNGIITGGSNIAVTTDGGNSWVAKNRPDFAASFYNINGFAYTKLDKSYFAVSNGVIYFSGDQATTLDPLYSNFNFQMNDVVGFGNDTVYAVGYSQFSIPAASRKSSFFRSTDAGATWQAIDIVATTTTPAFTAPTLSKMAFPSRNVGYVAGSRNGVYKTTDGGITWTKINPFPALNEGPAGFPSTYTSYTSIFALDDNTVFVLGNIFTTAGFRRLYKTTDGGATWTDISNNINTLLPSGNQLNVLFHDQNNGYVCGSNVLFVTNDGGANWRMEVAPHGNLQNAMGFAPRTVPASIPFANRKLFIGTLSVGSGIPSIMEYGDTLDVNVNTTDMVVNASCTNPTGGSITLNTFGGLAPYQYSINGGAFQSSNVFTGLSTGPKTIIIKDAFCGTITKTINVGFNDNLALTTNNDTLVCAGAPVNMLAATNGTGAAYAWTPAAGLSATNISNPVATVNSNTAFTVTASLNGCVRTGTVNISIKPNPVISAGPDKTIVDGDQVQLNGSSAANAVSITWTPSATLTNANSYTPVAKPATTTTYTLTVRDNNNCTSADDAIVTVIPYCMKVMNAFTPNGDGMNDRWLVTNGAPCTNNIKVGVYNRYGNVIYTNNNYANDWDGTFNGKPVADGTYYYTVTFRTITGKLITLAGDVTILR